MANYILEEGEKFQLDFSKLQGLAATGMAVLPTAVQNYDTGELLIIAYVNREALAYSLDHGVAAFWSTSRNELWVKGETSDDTLELLEVRVNCEQNSLLYRVRPMGAGACHTRDSNGKTRSGCYYRKINGIMNTTNPNNASNANNTKTIPLNDRKLTHVAPVSITEL